MPIKQEYELLLPVKINRVIVRSCRRSCSIKCADIMQHIMEMMGSGMMGMSSGMKDHTMEMTR
jgi:hypothetical protein